MNHGIFWRGGDPDSLLSYLKISSFKTQYSVLNPQVSSLSPLTKTTYTYTVVALSLTSLSFLLLPSALSQLGSLSSVELFWAAADIAFTLSEFTMTSIKMDIIANKELASFPSAEEILSQWKTRYKVAREANPGSEIRGVSLVDESGAIYAWLKFGPTVTMAEGRTQNYVAQVVNGDATAPVRVPSVFLTFESNRWGFIVMEFIDGETCDDQDSNDVAIALQFLVNIEGPNSVPGPIGGGRIRHPFFIDRESEVPYDSVGLLQAHVNSVSVTIRLAFHPLLHLSWLITGL